MAPLEVVDSLRMENMCYQEEDISLRPWYLEGGVHVRVPKTVSRRIFWGVSSRNLMFMSPTSYMFTSMSMLNCITGPQKSVIEF